MNFKELYNSMLSMAESTDEFEKELFEDVILSACNYAQMRLEWHSMEQEEKINRSEARTAKHNIFITNLTTFSRYYRNKDAKNIFVENLLKQPRNIIGDFACYIAFQIMLQES